MFYEDVSDTVEMHSSVDLLQLCVVQLPQIVGIDIPVFVAAEKIRRWKCPLPCLGYEQFRHNFQPLVCKFPPAVDLVWEL